MKDLKLILKEKNLQPEQAKSLLDNFGDLYVSAHKLIALSKGIKVTNENQKDDMASARQFRVKLMKIRTEADRTRKQLKEGYLRGGQAVQDIFNGIRDVTKPEEDRLKEQEKFAEIKKEKELEERHTGRVEVLSKYVEDVSVYSLKDMKVDVFNQLVKDCKAAHNKAIEAEKKIEKEKLDKQKKLDLLHQRQVEIAPYRDFTGSFHLTEDTTDEEFKSELEKAKKEKKKDQEEQDKIRKENERLKKEADKKAKEEQAKLEKEAKELREQKAQEDAEKKAEEEAEKKKLLAPDKEKLIDFASKIDKIETPATATDDAATIVKEAQKMLTKASHYLRESSKNL